MKKKFTLLFFVGMFAISIVACGNGETLEDGTKVTREENKDTYIMNSLNSPMTYKNSTFYISNVSFYEDKLNSEYDLWAILELDMSKMNEDDLHWLLKTSDSDFKVYFYIDSEKNNFDTKKGSLKANILYDKQTLMMAFNIFDYRYSLSEADYSMSIQFNNGDTYTPEDSIYELDKQNVYYFFNLKLPQKLESSETMNKTYYNDILNALKNTLNNLSEN